MSREFNGSSDAITLPTNVLLRPSLPVTMSAWVWADSLPGPKGVVHNNKTDSQHRGIWFVVSGSSGAIEISYGDGAGTTSADRRTKVSDGVIVTGKWHHIAGVVRGAVDMDLFIDGRDAGGTYSGSGGSFGYQAVGGQIGAFGGGNVWDGRIAHVAMWGAGLEEDEVLRMAQGLTPRFVRPASLLAYWPLTALTDAWINRQDATDATATKIAEGPDTYLPVGSLTASMVLADPGNILVPFIGSTEVLYDQVIDRPVFVLPLTLRWSRN